MTHNKRRACLQSENLHCCCSDDLSYAIFITFALVLIVHVVGCCDVVVVSSPNTKSQDKLHFGIYRQTWSDFVHVFFICTRADCWMLVAFVLHKLSCICSHRMCTDLGVSFLYVFYVDFTWNCKICLLNVVGSWRTWRLWRDCQYRWLNSQVCKYLDEFA